MEQLPYSTLVPGEVAQYLYQRYIVCVNESVFEMLNIRLSRHCDTFSLQTDHVRVAREW